MSRPMGVEVRRSVALEMALYVYVGEPCRICGVPIEREDLTADGSGAVFAGYSANNAARSAHGICWVNRDCKEWAHP